MRYRGKVDIKSLRKGIILVCMFILIPHITLSISEDEYYNVECSYFIGMKM